MDRLTEIRLWHEDVKMRYDDKPSRAHQDREVMLSEIDKLQAEVEKLTRERDEARSKETYYREGFQEGWDAAHEGAAAVVEKLRAALRWYADHRNHLPVLHHRRAGDPDPVSVFVEEPPITSDGGRRAREALEVKP